MNVNAITKMGHQHTDGWGRKSVCFSQVPWRWTTNKEAVLTTGPDTAAGSGGGGGAIL